uniref:hypothetical protein n=1 Tax=Acetatifactor sp. TaxID=1872090 RepID=UPI0040565D83
MDLHVEREGKEISLTEWLDYVKADKELVLAEVAEATNPITKQKLRIEIPGRVIFEDVEFNYRNGCIGCEFSSEVIIAKLKKIAKVFQAKVYDCGYEVE